MFMTNRTDKTFRVNRVIALFLSVVIVVLSLPFTAFAETLSDDAYAYVTDVTVANITDGIGPFDGNDEPGNDSSSSNLIVRSFDSVSYDVNVSMQSLTNELYDGGTVWVVAELDNDITHARFDLNSIRWIEDYTLEYFDKDGNSLSKGVNAQPKYTANDHATGSTEGENSYRTDVAKQVLCASYSLESETLKASFQNKFNIDVAVKAAPNGTAVESHFSAYMQYNESNITPDGTVMDVSADADDIMVSATGRFDARISENWTGIRGWADLANDAYSYRGQMGFLQSPGDSYSPVYREKYCVTFSLYGDTDSNHEDIVPSKGLKGCELPIGDIDITIDVSAVTTSSYPIKVSMWSWNYMYAYAADTTFAGPYASSPLTAGFGRDPRYTMPTSDSDIATFYYLGDAPYCSRWYQYYNTYSSTSQYPKYQDMSQRSLNTYQNWKYSNAMCYEGGELEFLSPSKDLSFDTASDSYTVHVRISDFDIDLDDFKFPTSGSSSYMIAQQQGYCGDVTSFAFDNVTLTQLNENITSTTTARISGVEADTISGRVSGEATGFGSVAAANTAQNNAVSRSNVEYMKGSMYGRQCYHDYDALKATGMSNRADYTVANLCTRSSNSSHYSAVAFPGDKVYVTASTMTEATNMDDVNDVNILQLIDTNELTILDEDFLYYTYNMRDNDGETALKGDGSDAGIKRFYVADPLYPQGYDSNDETCFKRMKSVKEEGLIYFDSLDAVKEAGFVCVGALCELRDVHFLFEGHSGYSTFAFSIPCQLSSDVETNKVIGSTFRFRAWVNRDDFNYSWADGTSNDVTIDTLGNAEDFKNSIENYPTPFWSRMTSSYELLKYDEFGAIVPGSNLFYASQGNSLQAIYYTVSHTVTSDKLTYNLDKSERVAKFTITNPKTSIRSNVNSEDYQRTVHTADVEISAVLPDGLSLSSMGVIMGGTKLSTDSNKPTLISYNYVNPLDGQTTRVSSYCWAEISDSSLTVHVEDAYITATLPDVEFYTEIAISVPNNTQLTVNTHMEGNGCSYPNDNDKSATIVAIVLGATSLYKSVDNAQIDMNGNFTYTIQYDNRGDTSIYSVRIYDILPYNNDGRGTSYHGSLMLDDVKVDASSGFTVGYSTRDGSELNTLMSESLDNYTVFDENYSKDATGFAVKIDELPAGENVKVTVMCSTDGNIAEDLYCNNAVAWKDGDTITGALTSNIVETAVVSRSISGFAFVDHNRDGYWADGEDRISGVTVTLFRKDDNGEFVPVIEDISGNRLDEVKTDDNGYYEFNNLPVGEYVVAFSEGGLDKYQSLTEWAIGDTQVNSKAVISDIDGYDYQSKYTDVVAEISLPEAKDMTTAHYSVSDVNLGVIDWQLVLPSAGTDVFNVIWIAAAVFTILFAITYSLCMKQYREN